MKKQQKKQGKQPSPTFTLPNRKSEFKTVEEEKEATQQNTETILDIYRQLLVGLLKKLSRIPDPRHPGKVNHKITVLMFYGILIFVFQIPSRRKANQDITGPQMLANLRAVFPEITEMPHQDTLCRLLEKIDVAQIETTYFDLLRQLIRKKKFKNLLHNKRYLVAIDGTQKYILKENWMEQVLAVGFQAFIQRFREVMIHRELDTARLKLSLESPGQLRLVHSEDWKARWLAA